MITPLVVGSACGLVALASGCIRLGVTAHRRAATRARRGASASTPGWWSVVSVRRRAAAVAVAFLALAATRWVAMAVGAGTLCLVWGRLTRDQRADGERARVAGIAKWLEDLRDALRGASISAEEALDKVAARPPRAIEGPLLAFATRRRRGERVEEALVELAEDVAHPLADAAIVAIRMVIGGTSGSARLAPTVSSLAASARDEVRARERVDRTRRVYHASMRRLVVIGGGLIGYLRFEAGGLLDPYGTPTGQLVALLPISMWIGSLAWLHRLCRYDLAPRHRLAPVDGGEQSFGIGLGGGRT